MQKTPTEAIHTLFIPDRNHIVSDIASGRGDVLRTLEEAIAYNDSCISIHSLQIKLDAYEEGVFITACAKALNELDKKDPDRAQQLLLGLEAMLDQVGLNTLGAQCDVAKIFLKKDKQ